MVRVVRHSDAEAFLASAEGWLLQAEAENNLILGVVGQLRSGRHAFTEPPYLSVVEASGSVLGCAFRTPPFGLGLTRMPESSLAALVDDVKSRFASLPSVVGPDASVLPFSEQWSRQTGCAWRVAMRQRIYSLSQVTWPADPPPGELRPATLADLPVIDQWGALFVAETRVPGLPSQNLAKALIDEHSLYVWSDGMPRSMAAARGPTPNGIRISFVYTPAQLRGRGYASACVAAVSQAQLDAGKSFCFLYTDLANPTSNSIYRRIGYQSVSDSMMCLFDEPAQ